MKKIVFLGDTILNEEPLGIQRYAYEIIKSIDRKMLGIECEFLIPEDVCCNITFSHIRIVRYGKHKKGFVWRQTDYPKYLKNNNAIGVDLTLGLSIFAGGIVCLHDCIFEDFPKDFVSIKDKLKRLSYLVRAYICVNNSKKILTVSETSRKELLKHYNVEGDKISVIYNAWQHMNRIEADDSIISKLNLKKGEYYFSLGSGLPHKNFEWIVHMAKNNKLSIFVVSGTNRLSKYSDILENINLTNIIFTGFLSDGEIKSLMSNCKAFLHPAFMEGFGIPPLEALSCGAKIAISSSSCLPEIYGDSAVYFDPFNYDVNLEEILTRETSAEETLQKYSWEKSADKLFKILETLSCGE